MTHLFDSYFVRGAGLRLAIPLLSLVSVYGQISGVPGLNQYASEIRPRSDSYAGNGVDTGSGAFRWTLRTLPFTSPESRDLPLTYDSLLTEESVTGPGWSHAFDWRVISPTPFSGATVTVIMPGGRPMRFRYERDNVDCVPLSHSNRYERLQRVGDLWRLVRPNGSVYQFNLTGELLRFFDSAGQRTNMLRNSPADPLQGMEVVAGPDLFLGYGVVGGRTRLLSIADQQNRTMQLLYTNTGRLRGLRGPFYMDDVQAAEVSTNTLSPTLRAVRIFFVNRTRPIGAFRITGRVIRTQAASGTRPTSPITVVVQGPDGRRFTVPSRTFVGRSGTSETLTWVPDAGVFDAYYGMNPVGQWQVLVRTNSGSGSFQSQFDLRFGDVADETAFEYDAQGRLASAVGPDGVRLFTNRYDSLGRVMEQDDANPNNRVAQFRYNETGGTLTTVYVDRVGNEWTYSHDAQYNLLSLADPLQNTVRYTYDRNGMRTRIVNPVGNITEFDYDGLGRLTSVWQSGPGGMRVQRLQASYGSSSVRVPVRLADALGNTTQFEGDASTLQYRRMTDAEGNVSERTYGGAGNLTTVKQGPTNTLEYLYRNGVLVGTKHPHDPSSSIQVQYDSIGRMVNSTEADGAVNTYRYNERLQMLQQTDTNGTLQNQYDKLGRLTTAIDHDGNATSYFYDGNGNRTGVLTETGRTNYTYDGEDRLLTETDPAGNVRTLEYDAAGRVVGVTEADGVVTRTEYDAAGNVVAERDGAGRLRSRTTYDFRELPVSMMDALGDVTKFDYDDAGRVVQVTDPLGRVEKLSYDKIGRLVQMTDPLGRRYVQRWNDQDRVTAIYDPNASSANRALVEFRYDRANRIASVVTPSGQTEFRYTKADQVERETTAEGRVRNYTYDTKGNLTRIQTTAPSSAVAPNTDVANEYDASGQLVRVTSTRAGQSPAVISRSYDKVRRLTRYTDGEGNSIRYEYDEAGNLSRLTYPDGKAVRYAYDRRGRITQVTDWANRITRLKWDPEGGVSRIDFPNGATRVIDYDRGGRAIRRVDRTGQGTVIVDYRYIYDAAGQLRAEAVGGTGAGQPVRISNATMTYGPGNVLTSYNGLAVTMDKDGNTTRAITAYRYDTKNNLVQAGGVIYGYDAEDRLISWTDEKGTTKFVVNPGPRLSQVLTRLEPTGRSTRYVYAVGLLYEESGTDIRVYHYDERGNTTALTNTAGQVDGRLGYSPYGTVVTRSGDTNTPFLFSGVFGVMTDPMGLAYMRFRWYSVVLRRFLNQDARFGSISTVGSLNRFAYAGNNPVLRADPEGEFWHVLAGAVIGAVVAVTVQAVTDVIKGKFSGFERYGAVALGGAVGGAIAAACGGILCAGAAGAAASATENLAEAAFLGKAVDGVGLLTDTATGAAFGLAGGAAGKALAQGPAKWSLKEANKLAPKVLPAAYARKVFRDTATREFREQLGKRVGIAVAIQMGPKALELLSPNAGQAVAPRINATAKYATEGTARQAVNEGYVGTFGEHAHWAEFLAALRLAGQLGFDSSVNVFAAF
jgi:RHS repeat-associated protein